LRSKIQYAQTTKYMYKMFPSIQELQCQENKSSTSKIQNALNTVDCHNYNAKLQWIENHPNFNFVEIGQNEDLLGIMAIHTGIFHGGYYPNDRFNDETIEGLKNQAGNALVTLAREDDTKAFMFLLKHASMLIPSETIAYAIGLKSFKQGYLYKIEKIEGFFDQETEGLVDYQSDNSVISNKLNKIAQSAAKGFFECEQFEDDELFTKDYLFCDINKIKNNVLRQKFVDKLNDIYPEASLSNLLAKTVII